MSDSRTARRAFAGLAVLMLLSSACGDDVEVQPAASSTTDAPATSSTTDAPEPPATSGRDVRVYFVAEVGEPSAGGVVDAIVASHRTIQLDDEATTAEVAAAALAAVIAGPDDAEAEIGFSNAVPSATVVNGVTIADATATVDLSGEFEAAAGAFSDTLRVAQVVFTLTAVDGVDAVRFVIDGTPRDIVGSHGVAVDAEGGVARDDLPEARPPILVESPGVEMMVSSPLTVTGESNTFEANVRWALVDPDGVILDEGFTTATAGNGAWGTFGFDIVFEAGSSGRGALILWEDSAEDGRQTNIIEVPIEFAPG